MCGNSGDVGGGDDGNGDGGSGGNDCGISQNDPLLADSSVFVFIVKALRTDGQMDGRTDGRTYGQTVEWMDGRMDTCTYGQTLLQRCEDASKSSEFLKLHKRKLINIVLGH